MKLESRYSGWWTDTGREYAPDFSQPDCLAQEALLHVGLRHGLP